MATESLNNSEEISFLSEYLLKDIYKILRIDLGSDTYSIIRANDDELTDDRGYDNSSFSGWIKGYANAGQIYQEDLPLFVMHTELEFLRRFFMFPDALFRIRYRRIVDDEFRLVMMQIIPDKDYAPDNQIVLMSIQDVDQDIVEMMESAKREENLVRMQAQYDAIKSIASIYASLHVIDLVEDNSVAFSTLPQIEKYSGESFSTAEQMHNIVTNLVTKDDLDRVLKFTDLTTLSARMTNHRVISEEFISVDMGWCRCQFIENTRDDDGNLIKVICTVQVIEQEKRREENLIRISNTDELTHVYNRRLYESDVAEYQNKEIEDDCTLILMDINGLKSVNDNTGHAAGDELIIAAARCMLSALGNVGRIYRTGGDEFIAIVHCDPQSIPSLHDKLDAACTSWHGEKVDHLAIAWGAASYASHPGADFKTLEHIADQAMYENKTKYYQQQ